MHEWIRVGKAMLKGRQYELFCSLVMDTIAGYDIPEDVADTKAAKLFNTLKVAEKLKGFDAKYEEKRRRIEQKMKEKAQEKSGQNADNQCSEAGVTDTVSVTDTGTETDITIMSNIDLKESKEKSSNRFVKPTVDEVAAYVEEKGYVNVDAEAFVAFYDSKGWKVGNQPMKNWKAAVVTWSKHHAKDTKLTPFQNNLKIAKELDQYYKQKEQQEQLQQQSLKALFQ